MSRIEAIEHSIRKWTGMLPKNLETHGVEIWGRDLVARTKTGLGTTTLTIDSQSCALCALYYDDGLCSDCPLYKSLGDTKCDAEGAPFVMWLNTDDVKPMIKSLKEALKAEQNINR